ncbi:IS3 family transposase [Streptomyces sp. NBC_01723]|uniref:IS3 family transposase n=1 Tax=Streptomyces sp. NBC_01723 TaxID=2975921 RepID=UPI003FCE5217
MRTIRAASGKTYGAKRITIELRESGLLVHRERIERLMRRPFSLWHWLVGCGRWRASRREMLGIGGRRSDAVPIP